MSYYCSCKEIGGGCCSVPSPISLLHERNLILNLHLEYHTRTYNSMYGICLFVRVAVTYYLNMVRNTCVLGMRCLLKDAVLFRVFSTQSSLFAAQVRVRIQ